MTHAGRLACAFAFAACPPVLADEPASTPPPGRMIAPHAAPAAQYIIGTDKEFICNFSMIGPHIAVTAKHCVDEEPTLFTFPRADGTRREETPRQTHTVPEHRATGIDRRGNLQITTNELYLDVAQDKALIQLGTSSEGGAPSFMRLAPLDRIPWRTPAGQNDYKVADVFILNYWPEANEQGGHDLYKNACRLIKINRVSEFLLHDCADVPGTSGSSIVVENSQGDYSVVAIMHGVTPAGIPASPEDDPLGVIINHAFPSGKVGLATGVWSLIATCIAGPCHAQFDARGHASLHLTTPPSPAAP